MNIDTRHEGKVAILAITGNLDAQTADSAKETIYSVIEAGQTDLVLALDNVLFMSSAGVRVILAGLQSARQNQGDLRLAGGSSSIKRMLDFSGFTKIMKWFETSDDAVASFSESA